ncbi:hypothetical protein CPB83DRAFT_866135 [Crepidotus variabilis]|uniref:Uncharacterized protein n=1 Tax=Crepidotus variabilis TaxID=179855 RepID=A0A9P6JW70_9AGAR|nr:hypothetical protein CPB83DRAFT_866135 [Crepidotus variabilis]
MDMAEKRDPDAHGMYIYNDFYAYAILDLIDTTLTSLHTKVVTKKWKDAFSILEALVMFASYEDIWTQCDDGQRAVHTFKALGSLCVTLLRKIDEADELDPEHYPSLESVLKNMVDFCRSFKDLSGKYGHVCKAIARRIFKDKSPADYKLEITRLQEWAAGLEDKEMKKTIQAEIKKMTKNKAGSKAKTAWYSTGEVIDENDNRPDFKFTGVWKRYRDYLSECPRVPLRGPPEWDLTEWTKAEREPYSFDSMGDFD